MQYGLFETNAWTKIWYGIPGHGNFGNVDQILVSRLCILHWRFLETKAKKFIENFPWICIILLVSKSKNFHETAGFRNLNFLSYLIAYSCNRINYYTIKTMHTSTHEGHLLKHKRFNPSITNLHSILME